MASCLAFLAAVVTAIALPAVGEAEETGGISGTVTAEGGSALEDADVCVYGSADSSTPIECKATDAAGAYEISGLAAGQYTVEFTAPAPGEYFTQFYAGASSVGQATAVEVTPPAVASGVDAALVKKPPSGPGKITGKVVAEGTGLPVMGVTVCAEQVGVIGSVCETTAATGEYEIGGLTGGQYTVEFSPPAPAEYFTQFYSGATSADLATPVEVTPGTVTPGIDATLVKLPPSGPGRIAGKVTAFDTGLPVAGVEVCAEQVGVAGTFCETTSSSGEYEIPGLVEGQYTVEFSPPAPAKYFTQYFSGVTSVGQATSVPVTAGTVTPGIDAALRKVPTGPAKIRGTVTAAEPARGSGT